jgi:hypothetical protein
MKRPIGPEGCFENIGRMTTSVKGEAACSKGSERTEKQDGEIEADAAGKSSRVTSSRRPPARIDKYRFRSDERRLSDALEDDLVREILRANRKHSP